MLPPKHNQLFKDGRNFGCLAAPRGLTWWQAGTSGGELQESFPLGGREVDEHVDKLDEGGGVSGVAQLWLGVPNDVLPLSQ